MTSPQHGSHCVRTRSVQAMLLVLAPAVLVDAPLGAFGELTRYPVLIVAAIAAVFAVAGGWLRSGDRLLKGLATAAAVAWSAGSLVEHAENPGRGLAVLMGLVVFAAFLWPDERLRQRALSEGSDHEEYEALVATGVASMLGLGKWLLSDSPTVPESLALGAAYLIAAVLSLRRARFGGVERGVLWVASGLVVLPLVDGVLRAMGASSELLGLGVLSPWLMFSVFARRGLNRWLTPTEAPGEQSLLDTVLIHPSRVLVLSFMGICAVGGLLLGLPVSSASGEPLSWLDAVFTAVSATCVTGLAVVDTPNAFGGFGQLMVLALIQVGGLGIMVFSAAATVFLGKRLSLSHERAAADLVGADSRAGLVAAIRAVVLVTAVTEGASALLLTGGFMARGDGLGEALWRGVFTAISAFCNAGFALQSDSLVSYADSPWVLSVVSVTIIVGGLGPAVIASLVGWERSARRSLHVKLVLWTTGILLVVPALLIGVLEWGGTLEGLSWVDKLFNAAFQSITLRTAGFNSIDLAQVHPATWTVMVLVMFVGGSPGSTAGGVRTTTIAVVILALASVVRGRSEIEVGGRTLPMDTVMRATAVTTLAILGCCGSLMAIQLTQTIPLDVALFEVVSALATVGLSTGGTGALDGVGKLIIIACMFAGRVGPLTLFIFLASNTRPHVARRYPEESVPIG